MARGLRRDVIAPGVEVARVEHAGLMKGWVGFGTGINRIHLLSTVEAWFDDFEVTVVNDLALEQEASTFSRAAPL